MPLVKRVLGLDAELTCSQSGLEAGDVVKGGVQSRKVVATCWFKRGTE